ncbi:hypothetical protein V1511DRAFT_500692 [Dipodascopsis uninucleata]
MSKKSWSWNRLIALVDRSVGSNATSARAARNREIEKQVAFITNQERQPNKEDEKALEALCDSIRKYALKDYEDRSLQKHASDSASGENDRVLHHYSTVMSVLNDLMSNRPGLERSLRESTRPALPSRQWSNIHEELRVCKSEIDLMRVFEYFFVRGKLSKQQACKILWNNLVKNTKFINSQIYSSSRLSGWSQELLDAFLKEVELREVSLVLQGQLRTEETADWLVDFMTKFPVSVIEQGLLSNQALRTWWYLCAKFYSAGQLNRKITGWLKSVREKEKADTEILYPNIFNAMVQMAIMSISTNNFSLLNASMGNIRELPSFVQVGSTIFLLDFYSSLPRDHMSSYNKTLVHLLRTSAIVPTRKSLTTALDIIDSLKEKRVSVDQCVRQLSVFVDTIKFSERSGENKSVSDAILLRRLGSIMSRSPDDIKVSFGVVPQAV